MRKVRGYETPTERVSALEDDSILLNMRALRVAIGLLFFVVVIMASNSAHATPVQFEWQLSGTDCAGNTVQPSDYDEIEILISDQPIPTQAGNDPCARAADGGPADVPPNGVTSVTGVPTDNRVTTDLAPGDYFIRARVRIGPDWSNFSLQLTETIARGQLRPPVIIRLPL